MVGFGPLPSRQRRREWWRRQIQRQHEGSLTVAEFCRRLGVSTVTFVSVLRATHGWMGFARPIPRWVESRSSASSLDGREFPPRDRPEAGGALRPD